MIQKKNRGISLIVLIITIVVIIILATAIIVNIAKANMIDNANEAVVKQDFKTMQEELDMYIADLFASSKGALDITTVDARTEDDVKKILKSSSKSKYIEYVTIEDGKIVIDSETPDDVKEWASEAINGVGSQKPTIPEEKTPVIQSGIEVTTENSSITGGKFLSTNPVIPVGFKTKETDDASWTDSDNDGIVDGWNNGLVIEDGSSNEFVWVPCTLDGANGSIKYAKDFTYPSKYSSTADNTADDPDVFPMKDETTRIIETEQIKKYGGFYIARYEAGVPANQTAIDGESEKTSNTIGIPVVQKNMTVWKYIDHPNAVVNAKSFINTSYVKSGIITGTAWDTVCTWIQSETDSEGNILHSVTNSRSWGNYYNSKKPANIRGFGEKQVTGFSDYWRAKNIYDIAGNWWEWTGEKRINSGFENNYLVPRGGYYYDYGSDYPAAYRHNYVPSAYGYVTFRIILYVM